MSKATGLALLAVTLVTVGTLSACDPDDTTGPPPPVNVSTIPYPPTKQ